MLIQPKMQRSESVPDVSRFTRLNVARHRRDPLQPADAFAISPTGVPKPPECAGKLGCRRSIGTLHKPLEGSRDVCPLLGAPITPRRLSSALETGPNLARTT